MSIKIESNFQSVLTGIEKKINNAVTGPEFDKILREATITLAAEMRERIHEKGLDSKNQKIGTYSEEYMKIRTGQFKNSGKKNSGFYTKGKNSVYSIESRKAVKTKESMRTKYNRTNETTVILSLTRDMENDFTTGPKNNNPTKVTGGWGIGWKKNYNAQKAEWLEKDTYKKKIFATTANERRKLLNLINTLVKKQLA